MTGEPLVSVVIPHYEAQADLDLVLTALTLQTHPATRLQVVVADDGSSSPPVLHRAGDLDTVLLRQQRQGFRAAAARNLGAAAADGEVLCFLDGDTIPSPGYVEKVTAVPARSQDALVVGRREHADLTGWTPERLGLWLAGAGEAPPSLPSPVWLEDGYAATGDLAAADERSFRFVISAVLCLQSLLFHEIGGFQESFTSYGGEDWELGWRAWCAGAGFAHVPSALAWHNGPDWSGRGGGAAAKNTETLALARLIPQPQTRGRGLWQPYPEVVVVLADGASGGGAALAACLDSLLAARDVGVWLDVAAGIEDPRVHSGAPPREVTCRARLLVEVHALCLTDLDAVAAELDALTAEPAAQAHRGGRMVVCDDEGILLTAVTTRAAALARRHGAGSEHVTREGATRLPAEPDLARLWSGW